MSTFVSILRGINVSGHKKIIMSDLKVLYKKLGFEDVQTYIKGALSRPQGLRVSYSYQYTTRLKLHHEPGV